MGRNGRAPDRVRHRARDTPGWTLVPDERRGDAVRMQPMERLRLRLGRSRSRHHARTRHAQVRVPPKPRVALRALGERLVDGVPDDQVADELVTTIRRSLQVPYVAVAVGDDDRAPVAAGFGT